MVRQGKKTIKTEYISSEEEKNTYVEKRSKGTSGKGSVRVTCFSLDTNRAVKIEPIKSARENSSIISTEPGGRKKKKKD